MPVDGGTAPAPIAPHPGRTTPLMYACSQGDLKQVQRILHDQPVALQHLDRVHRTPLHYCAGGSTIPVAPTTPVGHSLPPGARLSHCADLLLMAAPDLVHARDQDGFTPLHLAVIAGNVQLVQFLLANGADVKAKDLELHSVVHWATVCGETAALQAVLAAGAEVSTPDVHGGYPIHYAAQMCGSEKPDLGLQVLHILLSTPGITVSVVDNDGRQPLLWASSAGSARAVLALVRAGAAVESADKDGLTALHCAASRGHTDTLDTLLTLCGAQTDVIDSNGCTALHYSVTLGHADATALLLSHSADPNLQDRKGRSPAHCGCAKGQLETVRQLHAAGANLWLRTARGDLPLHEAAASGRRQLVKWLLDQRPSQVNARNNDGRGLLHLAALNDNADLCKILLDSGATVNPLLRTSKNIFMTPLDCALQRGFRSTAKFLQLHGGVPASRLNTLRLTSEVASNVSSGSHLHIREDVTVFGGSSSETDIEDAHRSKDHRGKRKTVRRKLSYRHERRRSYSGSEPEVDSKAKSKGSSKSAHDKRRSKSRDDAKSKDYKYSKHIDIKYDKRKKQQKFESEESVSETETSPEIRKNKIEHRNGVPINLEAARKTLVSDAEKKKSKKQDSIHEASDTEKSRQITSDRERKKSKKQDEESHTEDLKKKQKSLSSNGEEIKLPEEEINQKSSDTDKKQNKSKKSDISDSDNQKSKLSDSERKKKSAEKKAQKEKSIEEKVNEESDAKVKHDNLKQKSQEELNSVSQKVEVSQKELLKSSVSKLEDELPKQNGETVEDRKDSAKSTKPSSAKLTKPSKSASKSDETKSSTEDTETAKDTTLPQQQSEDTKHIEENTEQPSKSIQPDQISLQSKLSEGSPSKTIVVEAAVHHPPKGMSSEDTHEELSTVNEENKESTEKTSKVDAEEAKIDEDAQITEGKKETKVAEETEPAPEVQEASTAATAAVTEEESTVEAASTGTEEVSIAGAASAAEAVCKAESAEVAGATEAASKVEAAPTIEASSTAEVAPTSEAATAEPAEPKISAEETVTSENKEVNNVSQEIATSATAEHKVEPETKVSNITEAQEGSAESKQDEDATPSEETSTTVIVAGESSTKDETSLDQTATETEEQKKEDADSKKELNIDLSLKKFEESAEQLIEATDMDEKTIPDKETPSDEHKQKKYRKKVKICKSKDVAKPEDEESSSTSRETSSSESESEKSKKSTKNGEHKSFKVLRDDVAFEVLKDSPNKEKRVRKTAKKRAKEAERLNESATSSPEMLESARTRSKSVPRQKELTQGITLPSLVEKRPESNLSAPNLSSVYSDNEQKSGSNSEADDLLSSASRKKRIKKRSKLRMGSKSAGSDYESSNLIDSGFEPSPRSSRIPKRKVMSERGVNMTSVTQQIQSNIRKYHMERKIFQHLLDLKRLQIRSGQANESVLVKRAIDNYHDSVAASVGAGRYLKKDFTYKSFEQFLYHSLRMLQKSPVDHMKGLPMTADNPLLCTQSTHRCLHATHAYTGIPCAAYLPKMNHHTMPKIGFTPRSTSSFLPQINSKGKSVTLELCHGNDKQVISLPADRLDHNKRYYVTFTVKGQDGPSPVDQENTTSHRHAKSV